jgi:hypothetical protein
MRDVPERSSDELFERIAAIVEVEQILAPGREMYLPTEELEAELTRDREEAERVLRLAGEKSEARAILKPETESERAR